MDVKYILAVAFTLSALALFIFCAQKFLSFYYYRREVTRHRHNDETITFDHFRTILTSDAMKYVESLLTDNHETKEMLGGKEHEIFRILGRDIHVYLATMNLAAYYYHYKFSLKDIYEELLHKRLIAISRNKPLCSYIFYHSFAYSELCRELKKIIR